MMDLVDANQPKTNPENIPLPNPDPRLAPPPVPVQSGPVDGTATPLSTVPIYSAPATIASLNVGADVSDGTGGGSRLKFVWIFLLIFIFLLVCTSGAAYAIAYEKIKINNPSIENTVLKLVFSIPFAPKTPRILLSAAVSAQDKVIRQSFNLSLSVKSEGSPVGSLSSLGLDQFDGEISGAVDFADENNVKSTMSISLTKDFNVEVRMIKKMAYFKVNKIPPMILTLLDLKGEDLTGVFENWIAWDTSTLETEAGKELKSQSEKDKQTDEMIQRISDALTSDKILKDMVVSEEKIDGFDSYKLFLKATPEIIDYLDGAIREVQNGGRSLKVDESKLSDSIKELQVGIWIDKKDDYIRKMSVFSRIKPPDVSELQSPLSVLGVKTTAAFPLNSQPETLVSFVIKFSDFGQPVNVEVPSKTLKPEEFLKLALEQSPAYRQDRARSNDWNREADLREISSALKYCYVKNEKYPQTLEELKTNDCLTTSYNKEMPKDPETDQPYEYSTNAIQSSFILKAIMSDGTDCILTEKSNSIGSICPTSSSYSTSSSLLELTPTPTPKKSKLSPITTISIAPIQ